MTTATDLLPFTGLRPDPLLTIDEWADREMVLPSWESEPGQYRTSRTPYLREIMQCLSPSHPATEIIVMKAAQMGLTRVATNLVGYAIHAAPGPILFIEPTVDVAKKVSKQRIQPMLETVPCLIGKVKEARSRDAGNTILAKEFLGGLLVLTGANSGVGLRFMSARILVLDEVDAYPGDVDGEGSPCALAEKRTLTFPRRKIFKFSTPLEKLTSVIEPAYQAGSRGRYHVPCPHCDHPQALVWAQLQWPADHPEAADYVCEACLGKIPEHHKTAMLEAGQWVHEDPDNPVRSFHISALYAPYGWVNSWAYLAKEWVRIARSRDQRELKTFITTNLAETWEEQGEKIEPTALMSRREDYIAPVPPGVLILTAAVDVQDDRLEAEAIGWGLGEESWSIDYQRWMGSPSQADVWQQLDRWLTQTWKDAQNLPRAIEIAVIDTGGHHTKEAYEFVRPRQGRRVFALKGSNQPGARLVTMGTLDNLGKVRLFHIGTDAAKDTIFARLKLTTPGPGYVHFPRRPEYDAEYFAQLTAEEKRNKYEKGVLMGTGYHKIRARNEVLDLRCYNLAALAIRNVNLEALAQEGLTATPVPPPLKPSGWVQRTMPERGEPRSVRKGWMRR
jgi:phage terminase large subunit GpA-like protein